MTPKLMSIYQTFVPQYISPSDGAYIDLSHVTTEVLELLVLFIGYVHNLYH